MVDKSVIETRACYIQQLDNGVIRIEKKLGVELVLEDLDENEAVYKKLLKGRKGLFLIVYEIDCTSDDAFRVKASDPKRSLYKRAEAMLIKTLANRIEANFYKNNYPFNHPLKIFSNEAAAIEWLLSHS